MRLDRRGPRSPEAGATALALLLWLIALGLFVAPFLAEPDSMQPEGADSAVRSDLDIPFDEDVSVFEEDFGLELGAFIAEESEERFGEDSVVLADTGLIDLSRMRAGRRAYATHCIGCHGETGNGAGPAAIHLHPRPRNFRRGLFKFTSTDSGERPLPKDIHGTITRGLEGSSMPDFRLLSEEIRWDLTEYVRYLSIRGEFEQLVLDLAWEEEELPDAEEAAEIVVERWQAARSVYPAEPEPPNDADSVARGREVYFDTQVANCATCHGDTGVGDGPSAGDFNDEWGYPLAPRDLTTGVYRAGDAPEDLYRSIATGLTGTPMPAFGGSLSPQEIWDLVHFVQSLARN